MTTLRNNCMISIRLGFTLLGLISAFSLASGSDTKGLTNHNPKLINSFDLRYAANFNGMQIEAVHQLVQLDTGQFRETLEAKNFLGKVREQALFDISDSGQIIPREYSKRQRLLIGTRTQKQQFDWSKNQLTYTKGDQTQQIEIQPGYLDLMSHKLQLRRDVASGHKTLSYAVISRGKLKQYDYRVIGNEVLTTAIGPLNTRVIQRVTNTESKRTKIWLATDWDYLIVRLEKLDRGETQELQISSGQLNNHPVLPLKVDVEN